MDLKLLAILEREAQKKNPNLFKKMLPVLTTVVLSALLWLILAALLRGNQLT